MYKVIHKQIIRDAHGVVQEFLIPHNASILTIKMQNRDIVMWYEFHTKFRETIPSPILRKFIVLYTGPSYDMESEDGKEYTYIYIGTCIDSKYSGLVYHIYEVTEKP